MTALICKLHMREISQTHANSVFTIMYLHGLCPSTLQPLYENETRSEIETEKEKQSQRCRLDLMKHQKCIREPCHHFSIG